MKKKIILGLLLIGSLFMFTNCKAVEDAFSWSTWTFRNRTLYRVTVIPRGDSTPSYEFDLQSGENRDVTWWGYGNYYYLYDWYCRDQLSVQPNVDGFSKTITFEYR